MRWKIFDYGSIESDTLEREKGKFLGELKET
jgi:hypothetical protein